MVYRENGYDLELAGATRAQPEDIVRGLESGEKGLEDSLKLFEDGISLSRGLTQRLGDGSKDLDESVPGTYLVRR